MRYRTSGTAERYERIWDEMLSNKNAPHYMNLESDLDLLLAPYKGIIPEEHIGALAKTLAARVAAPAQKELVKTMQMVKRIKAGEASLGYTSNGQEAAMKFDLIDRFEFNCYQLAVFKKKYGLTA